MQRWRFLPKKKRLYWTALFLAIFVILISLAHELLFREEENRKDALERIRERGQLIALTDVNSLNYFVYSGNPMGYQLDLLDEFARYLGVSLKVIVSNDISRLYYYLDLHIGDLIALNLPVTGEGRSLLNYTVETGESRLLLVQRKKATGKGSRNVKYIRTYADFSGDTVFYRSNAFFFPLIRKFYGEAGDRVRFVTDDEHNTEQLVRSVAKGKINYALCPENIFGVLRSYYTNLDTGFVVSAPYHYGWGVDRSSPALLAEINTWFSNDTVMKELKSIHAIYFDNPRVTTYLSSDFCSINGTRISPFDKEIRRQSRLIQWDWRLLASLIYEESKFQDGVVSRQNASGLMQLMPQIAGEFGMDSNSSASAQISAGVKYIRWLDRQLPDEILNPAERVNFILAAYNVGIGRIMSARERAEKYGKDPNRWKNSVDYYLTHKSKKEPIEKTDTGRYGMPVLETEGYVSEILERYYHYRNIYPR
jgi:membrane-bound lytic murein transglycosylase F